MLQSISGVLVMFFAMQVAAWGQSAKPAAGDKQPAATGDKAPAAPAKPAAAVPAKPAAVPAKPAAAVPVTSPAKPPATTPAVKPTDAVKLLAAAPAKPTARPSATQVSEFSASLRVALLVAPGPAGTGLEAPATSASEMKMLAGQLEHQGYLVRIMAPPVEVTAQAVRAALKEKRDELAGNTGTTFVFAFSGLGLKGADGKNYLITAGVPAALMEKQALPLSEVQTLMVASGATRKLMLLDGSRGGKSFAPIADVPGLVQFVATRQVSHDEAGGVGLFFGSVVRGFQGKAAGSDGLVTFSDLRTYVARDVMGLAMKANKSQVPYHLGAADFLLAAKPPKADPPAPMPAPEVKPEAPPVTVTEAEPAVPEPAPDQTFLVGGKKGIAEKFHAMLKGPTLTLIREGAQNPIVLALVKHAKLSDGQLRFEGMNSGQFMHVVAMMNGQNIQSMQGRIGAPCPGDSLCADVDSLPRLPGEDETFMKKLQDYARATKKASGVASKIPFGRKLKDIMRDVKIKSGLAEDLFKAFDQLLRHKWDEFNLTAQSVSRQVQNLTNAK